MRKNSRRFAVWLLTIVISFFATAARAQVGPVSLKTLVDTHGSLVAGDVTITNFRRPVDFPVHFVDVRGVDNSDDVMVTANVGIDGKVNVTFTPTDPATGLPSPLMINAGHNSPLSPNIFFNMTYDVVVTNPQLKLHSVDSSFGPGTTTCCGGASTSVNIVYYFSAATGNSVASTIYMDGAAFGGKPVGGSLLPQVEVWSSPVTFKDYSAYRFGNEWGAISGPWGGIRQGQATVDYMTMTFALAPAAPDAGPMNIANLFADAVYLTVPAGPGGATIKLSSSDPTLLAEPASVTVPEGAVYARIPAVEAVVPWPVFVTLTGTLNTTTKNVFYQVWPPTWPPPVPTPVSVNVTNSGGGKVTSLDKNISCGLTCSSSYQLNATVLLTAQADSKHTFGEWGGACTGVVPSCTLVTSDIMNVVAIFNAIPAGGGGGGGGGGTTQFTLQVGRSNTGTVVATPNGTDRQLNCGSACSAKFNSGTVVTLTATPPAGKSFVGWGGACSGTATTCTVTMNTNLSVQANFSK